MRICLICETNEIVGGRTARYCGPCKVIKRKETHDAYIIRNGLVKKPGSGKGGNNAKGSDDGSYKSGIGYFQDNRKRIKEERRFCERCNNDLLDADRWHWCIHHRDHDRTNNDDSNFELLCKRCHQLEHECAKALNNPERVTTS